MRRALTRTFLLILIAGTARTSHAETAYKVTVSPDRDGMNVPVRVSLGEKVTGPMQLTDVAGNQVAIGQATGPSVLAGDDVAAELHFVMKELKAGEKVELTATPLKSEVEGFKWTAKDGKHIDLTFGSRNVMRYMHEAPDWSSKERLMETYKIYHHVFNPAGTTLLTKGAGGLFPHHRGLFFGFNRISYGDGKKADVWHCKSGETQEHRKVTASEAGPVVGRHQLEIEWRGQDKKPFAREHREMSVYHMTGGTMIEFATRVKTEVGPISLKGDPQHAGFQWRSTQHVPDNTKAQTYYIRPDGKAEPGKFRNWAQNAKSPQDKNHVNLPWHALSIVVNDERYTVCYLDRPENPKESRFSERDYGRFGSYFEYEVTEDAPLELNYRIWVQEGEMTVADVDRLAKEFVNSPKAMAEKRSTAAAGN